MKESYGKGLATHTDPESCGAVVGRGRAWTHRLLRGAHERRGAAAVSRPHRVVVVSRAVPAQSQRPPVLGAYASLARPLASRCTRLPSLSSAPYGRHYLRQEPDAGKPLVRIRGGGYG